MGRFANELPPDAPTYVGTTPPPLREDWHGQSGFEALGHKVPLFRKSAAREHLRDMGFTDKSLMWSIVEQMSNAVERDDPHHALERGYELGLDATGCYRLLAVLLASEHPAQPEAPIGPDATFVDLVTA